MNRKIKIQVTVIEGERTLGRAVAQVVVPDEQLERGLREPSDVIVDAASLALAEAYDRSFGHRARTDRPNPPCGCKSECFHRANPQLEEHRACKLGR